MGMIKKGILALTSTVMALGVATVPVFAEGEGSDEPTTGESQTSDGNQQEATKNDGTVSDDTGTGGDDGISLQADGGPTSEEFWDELNKEGYVELGKYKVEKIKDNVYHMDESTKELPGGATDSEGNMNNPSSIYFVERDDSVLMVDLGNPAGDSKWDAKTIVDYMVGEKTLSIVLTHSHGDHTGLGQSSEVFADVTVDKVYIGSPDKDTASSALTQFTDKIEVLNDNSTFTVSDTTYTVNIVNAHTEGSLMIEDLKDEVLFTGDTFGSGFVWLFWDTNNANPIAALKAGVSEAQTSLKKMTSPTILAGHRWQQFWEDNTQRPGEMSIQYFNDMSQVITGLSDGTTVSTDYTAGTFTGIELSSNGAKAKIDTTQAYVDTYLNELNKMDEAYVYSATNKLGIETVNNTAAATIVVYPNGKLTDEEAKKYLDDTGLTEYANTHASTVYVARPSGDEFTEEDVDGFKKIVGKITVSENFKLVGIGNGATFINENLSQYMNFVSGLALINPETTSTRATNTLSASVPTYVSGDTSVANAYLKANNAEKTSSEGTVTTYVNPDSKYEIVVTDSSTKSDVDAYKAAWDSVLCKFGRIGNYIEGDGVGTWYSRPLITGDEEADSARKYQYFECVDSITNMTRTIYTEDLDGDGIKSLWYVYVPEEVKDAKGTVPVVFLMHGNTNDPRTQYDTSGWASIASREGIILVCPEWQGHTYQGYTYDPMTNDTNFTANSDFITGCYKRVMEEFPQIDQSRVYISGLSAGCRNTTNNGLVNTKYFAAGAGQSGPFKNNEAGLASLKTGVAANKDAYDFPIIYFAGDKDEYLKDWDQLASSGGLEMAQLYAELNDMDIPDGNDEENKDLYGVDWDETYTIESDEENIAKIKGGVITSDNGVEISMNRIYGWGHWNYAPDAELMWEFMSKYSRDTETGATYRDDYVYGTQKVFVVGDDWGPAVNKTILTLDKEVEASSLKVENFSVTEVKENTDWVTNVGEVIESTSERTVTSVYLSDENGNKVNSAKGNIVTVEMYISPNDGSPFRYDLATGSNKWVNKYQLFVSGTATSEGKNVTVDVNNSLDLKDQNNWLTDSAYKFDVTNSYKGTDGTVMPYGLYSPTTDGKKHALVIWLHGAGEGVGAKGNYGNDNYVDLLGNEVTSLVSDEFQSLFEGGAYVLTPQAQTMWMDSGDGEYQNGDKGSMYEKTLFELIQKIVSENKDIDPNRVIIGGCSNGGYMTMEMVLKHPDYFYKAYPICEAFYDEYITDEMITAVKNGGTELWFTYAENDTTVDPTKTAIPTIKRMKAAGITVHTSVWKDVHDTTGRFVNDDGSAYQYNGHWSWTYFFNNQNTCDDCKKNEWKWLAEYTSEKKDEKVDPTPTVKPDDTVKPDNTKKEENKKSESKTTKTSDDSNLWFYGATFMIALVGVAGVVILKKRHN